MRSLAKSVVGAFLGLVLLGGTASAQTASPTPAASQAPAPEGARVFLVLDASGSMWGRVGNQTKIEVARETIRTLLKDWKPQDQLGLVAYGHRRKGDCSDIEVLKPVGKVDTAAMMAQVGAIAPKGMTPMSAAVKLAAEQLKTSEGVVSVILVSDGVETCHADPCAVAAELKKADVKLVVHTVGFDIQDRQAARQLQCMAEATGGLSMTANNAGELGNAIGKAVDEARKNVPAPPPPPPPPAPPAPKVEPKPLWSLEGSARLSENDDPLAGKAGISWDIRKADPTGGDNHTWIETSYNSRIESNLPPGDYLVEASAGSAHLISRVTIEPNKVAHLDVVLNAGRLGLRAKRTADQNQTGDVFWEVISPDTGDVVFNSYDPETSIILPAGTYNVTLALGSAHLEREVKVIEGDTVVVEIVAGVGSLQGKIVLSPGGTPVRDPFIELFTGKEPKDGEDNIFNSYENQPKADLAAGDYRARIRVDGVERTFPLQIKPGERTTLEFSLDAGIAAFDAAGAETIEVKGLGKDAYGGRTDVATFNPDFPPYVLPAGKYVAIVDKGGAKKEVPFEITAGQRTVVKAP